MATYSNFLSLISGIQTTVNLSVNSLEVGGLILAGSTSGLLTNLANATTSSYTITWPAAQGSANTYLKNDGSGNLTWAAAGTGTVTSVTFTGDGTILSSTPSSAVT